MFSSIPTFEAPPNDTTSDSLSNSTPSPVSNTQVTSANNNNNNIEVNDELTIDIDDGDGDESISNGNDESKHKEVASTTVATQFAAYSTISSIESTTTTYSTAQTITTSTNLINNPEGFEISTTPAKLLYDAVLHRAIWFLLGEVPQRTNNELALLFLCLIERRIPDCVALLVVTC